MRRVSTIGAAVLTFWGSVAVSGAATGAPGGAAQGAAGAAAGAAAGGAGAASPGAERAPSPALAVDAGNEFAFDLYEELSDGDGNLFLSPHSIHVALAMTWAGARGKTAEEMAKALGLEGAEAERAHASFAALLAGLESGASAPSRRVPGSGGVTPGEGPGAGPGEAGPGDPGRADALYQLSVANALWGQKGFAFRDEFLDLVESRYGGGLEAVDFARATEAARATINAWVGDRTKGKIPELIPSGILSADTRLVLTNAVYFKSGWLHPFEAERTVEAPFHLPSGAERPVPLMRQVERFGYLERDGVQAVDLPYAGGRLSMVILLPREPGGLPALERTLDAKRLGAWLGDLRARKVDLSLPRFQTRARFRLAQELRALGMREAFAWSADFSGMTDADRLFISEVIHEAFVRVDEEGTEAAAATAVIMDRASAPRPEEPVVFRADRPFLYLIRHRATGAILFLGRLVEPAAAEARAGSP